MQVGSSGNSRLLSGTLSSASAIKKSNSQLKKILTRLSTAQRINKASDDAAGLSISEMLRTNIRGYKMATRNIEDAMSALNISDGTGDQVSDMLQRQRELAIAARNDTLNDNDRQILNQEYQALTGEIGRITSGTQFNRQRTADGTELGSGQSIIQSGPEVDNQIILPEINYTEISTALSSTSVATSTNAQDTLTEIDKIIQNLNEQRSTIGATMNRFNSAVNNLSVSMINTQAAESVLRDQDMAEGISELTRQQLLNEGGIRAFKRFNEISRYQVMGILDA